MWAPGAQRLRDYVSEHGAGMIDAWLAGQCINHRPGGFNLNCYAAQSRPVLKEHVGGYLRIGITTSLERARCLST